MSVDVDVDMVVGNDDCEYNTMPPTLWWTVSIGGANKQATLVKQNGSAIIFIV